VRATVWAKARRSPDAARPALAEDERDGARQRTSLLFLFFLACYLITSFAVCHDAVTAAGRARALLPLLALSTVRPAQLESLGEDEERFRRQFSSFLEDDISSEDIEDMYRCVQDPLLALLLIRPSPRTRRPRHGVVAVLPAPISSSSSSSSSPRN